MSSWSSFVLGLSNKDVAEHRHGNSQWKIRLSAPESSSRWETGAEAKKLPLCSRYVGLKTTNNVYNPSAGAVDLKSVGALQENGGEMLT